LRSMAEREGFEPPIPVKVCLISSQVHSTALPSLRFFTINTLQHLPFAEKCSGPYAPATPEVYQFRRFTTLYNSSPAESRGHRRENRLEYVDVVGNAKLVRHGEQECVGFRDRFIFP
jgi:hypothetical protein